MEKYLQEAKKLEESKIREREAFEWSKQAKAPSKVYSLVRSILATSGLVLLSLIGIDFYMKEKDQSGKTIADYQNEESNKLSKALTTNGPFTVGTTTSRTTDAPVILERKKLNWFLMGILLKMDRSMMRIIINNCPGGKNYSGESKTLGIEF